jgi:hypothetical protein
VNLIEIRNLFTERSGRFDLVDSNGNDQGADFFIQGGVRFLDRAITHLKSVATRFIAVTSGDFYKTFTSCRAIQEIWISDTESRTQLKSYQPIEFYQNFAGPVDEMDTGRPAYYTPLSLRATDTTAFESLAQFLQYATTEDETISGIAFNPADGDYVLEVIGLFESDSLENNTDDNFWSVNFPDLLLMASLYKLEVFNRNTAGANDWLAAINTELSELEKDLIEQDNIYEDRR